MDSSSGDTNLDTSRFYQNFKFLIASLLLDSWRKPGKKQREYIWMPLEKMRNRTRKTEGKGKGYEETRWKLQKSLKLWDSFTLRPII